MEQREPRLHQASAWSHWVLPAESTCLLRFPFIGPGTAPSPKLGLSQESGRATAVVVEPGIHGEWVALGGVVWRVGVPGGA